MKKLVLVLVLFSATLTMSAQLKNPIKSYKITTTGYSNGLIIPTDFVIDFVSIYTTVNDNSKWLRELETITYLDTSKTNIIHNDSIPGNFMFKMPKTYRDSTMRKTLKKFIGKRLKNIYGNDNVVVIQ
jgi:thiamine kinase-like enzyme